MKKTKETAGRVRAIFVIDEAHAAALRDEALKRAAVAGTTRGDASAVVREILDAWVKKRAR